MKVNKIRTIVLICVIILQCNAAKAQEFAINGNWKVSWDDQKEFSKADFNDATWETLPTLNWSDDHKTTANRVLWIRTKVVIPSSLTSQLEKTGLLTLSMGKISQSDDTYLNGKLIGATGSGDSYRNYLVKKEDILWDQPNTISIRVRHWGSFQVSKQPTFIAATPAHFLSYISSLKSGDTKAPVTNKELIYQLSVNSRSPKTLNGMVKADFFDFDGNKVFSAEKSLTISPGKNTADFAYTATTPFLKILYTFSSMDHQYSQEWNAEYGYQNLVYKKVAPVVNYKAPQKYFPPSVNQQVVGGWIGDRLKANTEQRLYKVDEDALLAGFINRPGSHSWIGEHIGKFLEAACNAYENTGDADLKIQIDRSAQQLIAAQLPDGYLGTYEMDSHWTSWDVWSHRYDLMGLLRYYELSGFKPALSSCEKIGNLLIKTFGTGDGQRNIIKAGGHVGMAATCILESMAELYRFTGEKKYLDFCYFIIKSFDSPNGPRIITTLNEAGRVDKVANAKAYEMLSNMLGILKLYRLTNDEQFLKPMLTAWNDISKNRLYITG
ncbi:MAG: beta-L-arabinofuranosidase domain-containing protein, partial [Ferruginibacter sp.]